MHRVRGVGTGTLQSDLKFDYITGMVCLQHNLLELEFVQRRDEDVDPV